MAETNSASILETIRSSSAGATRQEIIKKLGSERSVTRYLAALLKTRRLRSVREGKEVRYFVRENAGTESGKAEAPRQENRGDENGESGKAEKRETDRAAATPKAGAPEGLNGELKPTPSEANRGDPSRPAAERDEPAQADAHRDQPKDTAAPPAEPAANGAAAGSGIDPDFPDMAEVVALDVVLGGMTKQGAVLLLKKAAHEYHKEGDAVMAFVRYALQRIDRITPEEVEDLGVDPEQFAEWQRRWAGDYGPAATDDGAEETRNTKLETRNQTDINPQGQAVPQSHRSTRRRTAGGESSDLPLPRSMSPTGTANVAAKGLAKWFDEVAPGLPPELRRIVLAAAAGLIALIATIAGANLTTTATKHPWYTLGALGGLGLTGYVWLRRPSAARAVSTTKGQPDGPVGLETTPEPDAMGPSPSTTIPPTTTGAARGTHARRRWPLAALLAVILLAGVAVFLWTRRAAAPRPAADTVREYLVKNAGTLPVRLADLRVTFGDATEANCRLTYEARFETTEPLFRQIDAADYLRTHYAAESAAIDAAAALLRSNPELSQKLAKETKADGNALGNVESRKSGNVENAEGNAEGLSTPQSTAPIENRESRVENPSIPQSSSSAVRNPPAAGPDLKSQIANFKSGALAPVLVTTATPPGASAAATGTLVAWKHDTTWIFTGDPVRIDRTALAGDPKPAGALAVDLPEDAGRLRALIAEQVAYAGKVQAAAKALAAQREREVQQRKAAFSELLRVGTLFTGVVNDPTKHQPQRFVLEITAATPRLTAVLRNDGGWTDARTFQGEWSVDAEGEVATVTLRTLSNAAIDTAGPLLQDRLEWALSFGVRLDAEDFKLQSSNSKLEAGAIAPTALVRVDPAGVADLRAAWTRGIAAVLAATRAGAGYRGTALSKIYRTEDAVVLRFGEDVGRDLPIPPNSGTQTRRDTGIPPYINPAQPVLLDATLAPAGGGAGRAFRGTVIANTYRAGGSPIRLQSADADRVAGAGGKSVFGVVTGAGLSMALRLEADRLVGEDGWFVYEFAPDGNVGGNAELGTRNAEGPTVPPSEIRTPQSPAPIENRDSKMDSRPPWRAPGGSPPPLRSGADPSDRPSPPLGSVENPLPPFPTAAGAYGLVGGRWVALPHNNPQVAVKGKRLFDGFFTALEGFERKLAGQPDQPASQIYGALTFDGREPVPWLAAGNVVICYVGELQPIKPALLKKYPALKLEPLMELGMLHTLPEGSRSILLSAIYPDVPRFGPRDIEATVEQRPPNVVLLRCPGLLDVGRYAVTCNEQLYELGVIAAGAGTP